MKSFCYLGNRLNASDGGEAAGNSKNKNWMDKI